MKQHRNNLHLYRCFLLLIVIAVSFLCLAAFHEPRLADNGSYDMAIAGEIPVTVTAEGIFIYEETVVVAAAAGTYSDGFRSGDQVAAGETVGELKLLNDVATAPVRRLVAPGSGLYSAVTDGLENVLTKENIHCLEPSSIFAADTEAVSLNGFVRSGAPCFKIMDNKADVYLLLAMGNVRLTGESIALEIDGVEVEGKTLFVKKSGDGYFTLVQLPAADSYFATRRITATVITGKKQGIVIDAAAVTKRFGETGVYLVDRGQLNFCPLTVEYSDGEQAIVKGIPVGACIFCEKIG